MELVSLHLDVRAVLALGTTCSFWTTTPRLAQLVGVVLRKRHPWFLCESATAAAISVSATSSSSAMHLDADREQQWQLRHRLVGLLCFADALLVARKQQQRVGAGPNHTALASGDDVDGGLFCCGVGGMGQLGHGERSNSKTPVRAALAVADGAVVQVACGQMHTMVLAAGGHVLACGAGTLGIKRASKRQQHHSQTQPARREGGGGRCRGGGTWLRLTRVKGLHRQRVVQLAAATHSAAVTESGALFTWGHAGPWLGLGDCGSLAVESPTMVRLPCADDAQNAAATTDDSCRVVHVAVAEKHSIAIMADGSVLTCGAGRHGKLGHASTADVAQMRRIEAGSLYGRRVVQGAAGATHSVLLALAPAEAAMDGVRAEIYTFGCGRQGQLGHGSWGVRNIPTRLLCPGLERCLQVAASGCHSAAVTADGDALTWGCGAEGQLGHGNRRNCSRPTKVQGLPCSVAQLAAGDKHTVLLGEHGGVWTFGAGWAGQLGRTFTTKTAAVPVQLVDLPPLGTW